MLLHRGQEADVDTGGVERPGIRARIGAGQ